MVVRGCRVPTAAGARSSISRHFFRRPRIETSCDDKTKPYGHESRMRNVFKSDQR